jgi:uncharacterized membrane protein (DUF106 family)
MLFFPIQMQIIKFFFSGFVVGKLGIQMGWKFKEFLQSGLNLQNLHSEYLSAVSMYFICYLGIGKIIERFLKLEEENAQQSKIPQAPMNPFAAI